LAQREGYSYGGVWAYMLKCIYFEVVATGVTGVFAGKAAEMKFLGPQGMVNGELLVCF
jgi:hypothetical protein